MSESKVDAYYCEALKYAYRQTKDGIVVSFVVHPDDIPDRMASAPLGTRLILSVAEMADDDTPAQPDADRARLVQQAALLPKEVAFRRWLFDFEVSDDRAPEFTEDEAKVELRRRLGVASRADIKTNSAAALRLVEMRNAYLSACGRTPGGI
ncbi:MAG TPA: hypothetical protein VGV37_01930 [Aliidongia sp.]|uniref:hypothetical protein n=1 Tax=Aliidongia sp. TaxID=1914230 RepID=UPI002DDD8125|nr:hypothetical protein [Aliidongia sp.]HEV2673270.1 hypothetical protein [Aliidongia sp.]